METAIEAERPGFSPPTSVTGLIVPHHLLAADLIARAVWAASGRSYKRIVLISPDHFRKAPPKFSTTLKTFDPVFAPMAIDEEAVRALADHDDLVFTAGSLDHEHGLTAVVPFLEYFFADAKLVPLITGNATRPEDWRKMVQLLKPLMGKDTLVIQSTDFSHYLPLSQAVLRDQESLAILARGDPEPVADLVQPAHLDSKAAFAIQLELQKSVFHSTPVVLANRSSVDYGGVFEDTTTYVPAAFVTSPTDGSVFEYDDQSLLYFGGDVLLGRYLTRLLRDPIARVGGLQTIFEATRGRPLIANLEGVLREEPVYGAPPYAHVMALENAAPALEELNVTALSLANNHSYDLGTDGYRATVETLRKLGITVLEPGRVTDLGAVRVAALNYVRGRNAPDSAVLSYSPEDTSALACGLEDAPPLIAFVHWGRELTDSITDREQKIANELTSCGFSAVIGAHSHQASSGIIPLQGGRGQTVFSLGNLVFDQRPHWASGSVLEMRVFRNGTLATRLIPIRNVFEDMEKSGRRP